MGTCLGRKHDEAVLQDPQDFAAIRNWAKIHPRPSAMKVLPAKLKKPARASKEKKGKSASATEMVRLLAKPGGASDPLIAGARQKQPALPRARPREPSYQAPRLPCDSSRPTQLTCLQMLIVMQEERRQDQQQAGAQVQTQAPPAAKGPTPKPCATARPCAGKKASPRPLPAPQEGRGVQPARELRSPLGVNSPRPAALSRQESALSDIPERSLSFSTQSTYSHMSDVSSAYMAGDFSPRVPTSRNALPTKSFRSRDETTVYRSKALSGDVVEPLLGARRDSQPFRPEKQQEQMKPMRGLEVDRMIT